MSNARFLIVIPYYEDKASLLRLLGELASGYGGSVHLLLVDDGSVHEPAEAAWVAQSGLAGQVITLSQNMGHQKAIAIGLSYAAEHFADDYVLTMDSDGEDMPSTIPLLLQQMNEQVDVVVAQRRSRVETLKFKFFYVVYKNVFKLLSGRIINFGNFAFYSPAAVARLSKIASLWIHVAGTVLGSKLRIHYLPLDRGARYAGKSKMNFVALTLHGFRSLMVFAEDVLVRVGLVCGLLTVLCIAAVFIAVLLKIAGIASQGWLSMVLGVFLLVMVQIGLMLLTTIMLTGVMKGVLSVPPDYRLFIKSVQDIRK